MLPFQKRGGPRFHQFSSKILPFQKRSGPLEKGRRTMLKPAFWHFRVTFPPRFEGGRVGRSGRSVGSLLFRTHSQQRARASRGQIYMDFSKSCVLKHANIIKFSVCVYFIFKIHVLNRFLFILTEQTSPCGGPRCRQARAAFLSGTLAVSAPGFTHPGQTSGGWWWYPSFSNVIF